MFHLFGTNRANCYSSRVVTESNPLNVSGNRYFPFTWEQDLFSSYLGSLQFLVFLFVLVQMIFFDILLILFP